MDILSKITQDVEEAYVSLSSPMWTFAQKRYDRRPYAETVEQLRVASFTVEESTDLNYDVSCAYYLHKANQHWALHLSLVGKFAALLSIGEQDRRLSFTGGSQRDEIATILSSSEIVVLSEEILSSTLSFGGGGAQVSIYSVLFEDLDELPWERE